MIVDLATQSHAARYQWMTQAIIPRPIAWTLTANQDHSFNLAPFSYFNALCSSPPLIGLAITRQKNEHEDKDTLVNIRARQYFVVHIANLSQLPMLNDSSASWPSGQSEVSHLRLATESFADFPLPRVADCPLALACVLQREIDLADNGTQILVIGEIKFLYAADSVLSTDNKNRLLISPRKVRPVARLAAGNYAALGEFISLSRPA